MNIVIIYGTTYNTTKGIVQKMAELLNANVTIHDAKDLKSTEIIDKNDFFIFVSPTYGDYELQIDIEKFLTSFSFSLQGKYCALCETGNYDGYDECVFGAYDVLKYHLDKTGCTYLVQHLSLDALPKVDWNYLKRWCDTLNISLDKHTKRIAS